MNQAEKNALITLCRIEIRRWKNCQDKQRSIFMVQLMEIALASLTAEPESTMQPVKAPKQDLGTFPPARIKQARDMEWIRAIREAGGTVQESE